jgi:hypothetical protein
MLVNPKANDFFGYTKGMLFKKNVIPVIVFGIFTKYFYKLVQVFFLNVG